MPVTSLLMILETKATPSSLVDLTTELRQDIHDNLKEFFRKMERQGITPNFCIRDPDLSSWRYFKVPQRPTRHTYYWHDYQCLTRC